MSRVLVDARTPMNYEMLGPIVQALAADERIQFAGTASEEPTRSTTSIDMHLPPCSACLLSVPHLPGGPPM
jgi:hypothetical protein